MRAHERSKWGGVEPFGAPHRVHFDTPSLKGSCGESVRIHGDGAAKATVYEDREFMRIRANPFESTLWPEEEWHSSAIDP